MPDSPSRDFDNRADKGKPLKAEAYKTRLCRHWVENRSCLFAHNCVFAHGEDELTSNNVRLSAVDPLVVDSFPATHRSKIRPEAYKTSLCRNWQEKGACSFGDKCAFAHGDEELRMKPLPVPLDESASQAQLLSQVSQLLMLLDAAERRVYEAELQTQRFQAALCLGERETEARYAQSMEGYLQQAHQLNEALRTAREEAAAQEAAHRRAEQRAVAAEQSHRALQLRCQALESLTKAQLFSKGGRAVEFAEEVLEAARGVLEGCGAGAQQPADREALARLEAECTEAMGTLETIERQQNKLDASTAELVIVARVLLEKAEQQRGALHGAPERKLLIEGAPGAASVKAERPVKTEAAGTNQPSSSQPPAIVKLEPSVAVSTSCGNGVERPRPTGKRQRSSTPPLLPTKLLRRYPSGP